MHDEHPREQHSLDSDAVARAYDRWSARYDSDRNLTRDLDARVVRDAPLRLSGQRVVELGCGTGKNSVWLASEARELVALDFSEGMLAEARERVRDSRVRFARHDIRDRWPIETRSAGVVVGNLVLEHVSDLAPVYAEAARVLGSGGQLFLCELHPYRQLRGSVAHFADPATNESVAVPAFRHSMSEFLNAGLTAGFVVRSLGEWTEEGAPDDAPPRLVSLLFDRE